MGLMRRQPCFFFYSVYITEVVLSALRNHHTTATVVVKINLTFFVMPLQSHGRFKRLYAIRTVVYADASSLHLINKFFDSCSQTPFSRTLSPFASTFSSFASTSKSWMPCLEATIPSSKRRFLIAGAFKPLRWKNTIRNFLYDENTISNRFVKTRDGAVLIATRTYSFFKRDGDAA